MTVLITGGAGQDAHYLAEHCGRLGARVVRTGRKRADITLDVTDFTAVESVVREAMPDYVFHFAADSRIAHDALFNNLGAISAGAVHVMEACWRHCRGARIFLPGSALQFENTGRAVDEQTPFAATSAYAVARTHMTYAARYFRSLGLRCYVGYLFHHDSPLRPSHHLSQRIAQAALRIAGGSDEVLGVGNLAVEKEWGFAGDTVQAMWILLNQEAVFEAVIGTGEAYPVQRWVDACFGALGLRADGHVRQLDGYRADFERLVSRPVVMRQLGWAPQVSIDALARMMVQHPQIP